MSCHGIIIYFWNTQHFYKHTQLAIIVSLPTLYSHLFAVSLIICKNDVNKCELRCQLIKAITFQGYRLYWSFEFQKIQKKTKLVILTFLYCGEIVKNSTEKAKNNMCKCVLTTPILACISVRNVRKRGHSCCIFSFKFTASKKVQVNLSTTLRLKTINSSYQT